MKNYISLCEELDLEEAVEMSYDRLRSDDTLFLRVRTTDRHTPFVTSLLQAHLNKHCTLQ